MKKNVFTLAVSGLEGAEMVVNCNNIWSTFHSSQIPIAATSYIFKELVWTNSCKTQCITRFHITTELRELIDKNCLAEIRKKFVVIRFQE